MQKSILVTGGTGMIGQRIVQELLTKNQRVKVLTRSPQKRSNPLLDYVVWNPAKQTMDPDALYNVSGILHLAGAPVAQRWSEANKRAILDSRVQSSALLYDAIAALPEADRPECIIGASAIGVYPSSPDWAVEESAQDEGFSADVVRAWEEGVHRIAELGVRAVSLRIGLVLDPAGGMLGKLLPLFRLGLGSATGSGNQWQSWVHAEDVERAFLWALSTHTATGIYNLAAPHPVTNQQLSAAIASACHRPFWAPNVPAFALKAVYGEMASIILASQRVRSTRLVDAGFTFRFESVEQALADLL